MNGGGEVIEKEEEKVLYSTYLFLRAIWLIWAPGALSFAVIAFGHGLDKPSTG
jgi:hypothetical protein